MKTKRIIAAAAAALLVIGAVSGCGCKKQETPAETETETVQKTAEKPTFMYFISNSDEDFDKTNDMLDELQKEYDGKVNFKIVNIDDNNTQALVGAGQTPTLVLTSGGSGEATIKNKCSDKDELKQCIEDALNK